MAVLQEAKKQSVRLSAGQHQISNAEKGCSSIVHNIAMKAVGPGAAALSGTDWTDAVSDAYKAEVIYFLSLQRRKSCGDGGGVRVEVLTCHHNVHCEMNVNIDVMVTNGALRHRKRNPRISSSTRGKSTMSTKARTGELKGKSRSIWAMPRRRQRGRSTRRPHPRQPANRSAPTSTPLQASTQKKKCQPRYMFTPPECRYSLVQYTRCSTLPSSNTSSSNSCASTRQHYQTELIGRMHVWSLTINNTL
jgi:hypothetical protein